MDTAAGGVAQNEDDEERIDEQDIFDGVVLFLAAITRGLLRRVLGADDAPFGPVMGKRGEVGAVAGVVATGGGSSGCGGGTGGGGRRRAAGGGWGAWGVGAATGAAPPACGGPTGAAPASETPRRWARAVSERAGASPR